MSGMSDQDYENRRAAQRLYDDMQLIDRQRRRARACDMLERRLSAENAEKVTISAMGRIKAWLRPKGYASEDTAQMQLTGEEVRELREWLGSRAHKLREHADSIERKRAGVGDA